MKKWMLLLVCASLIFSQSAFAARVGGGKSYGMQRSNTNSNYSQNYTSPQSNQMGNTNSRPGMGAGTAAMLGAAAGAAGGYMLGKSMNGNQQNASGTQVGQSQTSNIPWGMIAILAVLLFLGLMLFRKSRANPGFLSNTNLNPTSNNFSIPTINRTNTQQYSPGQSRVNAQPPQSINNINDKMPDGIETIYFLRQVKGMFLHIQSMNNLENVAEVEKYMTPNLYQEIKGSMAQNSCIADFSNLDCQLLNTEIVNNQLIASVKFFGLVSDEPNQPPKPFSEIWNFVKSDLTTTSKWFVAGIQQEILA